MAPPNQDHNSDRETHSTPRQTDVLLTKALTSASSLVLLQFCSRIFTFILNQALLRLVSPQVFGTAAIQFELLLSTILFLSREGVRNALLRVPENRPANKSADEDGKTLTANVATLPVLLGVPAAVLISLIYVGNTSAHTASQRYFGVSVAIYALAASLELLSEPLYIRARNELRFDLRVRSEGVAVLLKNIVTFVILVTASSDGALIAFAIGQGVYGFTLLVTYLYAYKAGVYFWPKRVTSAVHGNTLGLYFDPTLLQLSAAMTGQSLIKHFLTEGDKFLVSRLSPLADQGGYAIASNYGSLVARIILQPIEETSRLFFAKTLSSPKKDREALRTAANMLLGLLLLFTHLLLLVVTFGPPYLALALSIVLPRKYLSTSAPTILGVYMYYIPVMAFNGVLEAFFASVSSPADLHAQSRWMFMFSVGFIVVAVGLAKGAGLGDAGLVWANVANLLCRATYAWSFALRFFASHGGRELADWRMAVPPKPVLLVFGMSALATRWSEARSSGLPLQLGTQVQHVAVGVCGIIACLAACVISEQATVLRTLKSLRRRQ